MFDGISPSSTHLQGYRRPGVTLRRHAQKSGDRCTMRRKTDFAALRTVDIVLRRAPCSVGQLTSQLNTPALQQPRRQQVRAEASGHQPADWFREDVAGRRLAQLPSGVRWMAYAMIIALTGTIVIGVGWVRAWWAMP